VALRRFSRLRAIRERVSPPWAPRTTGPDGTLHKSETFARLLPS